MDTEMQSYYNQYEGLGVDVKRVIKPVAIALSNTEQLPRKTGIAAATRMYLEHRELFLELACQVANHPRHLFEIYMILSPEARVAIDVRETEE